MNMENLTDFIGSASDKIDVVVGGVCCPAAWFASKFEWWRAQSKLVKALTFVGIFVAAALVLSLAQGLFG
jgi:hypothetical protein